MQNSLTLVVRRQFLVNSIQARLVSLMNAVLRKPVVDLYTPTTESSSATQSYGLVGSGFTVHWLVASEPQSS